MTDKETNICDAWQELGIERIERKGSERQHCGEPSKYDKCENEEKCGIYCDMAPHW